VLESERGLDPKTQNYVKKVASVPVRQIITAGGKEDKAIEDPSLGHGLLTYKLLQGLDSGIADTNSDDVITGSELGNYLRGVVPQQNSSQFPQFRMRGEGDFMFLPQMNVTLSVIPPKETGEANFNNLNEKIKRQEAVKKVKKNWTLGIGGKYAVVLHYYGSHNYGGHNNSLGLIAPLGTIIPQTNVKAEASVEYWGESYSSFGYREKWSCITFNGTAKYYFTSSGMSPFVGGGLALILTRSSIKGNTDTTYGIVTDTSSSDTDIGFHLVGGVDIPLGPSMKFVVEGKLAKRRFVKEIHIAGGIVVKLK